MGRPPAYIFVVRHGNRLDAADKQWHLSSPTPYDPPLTYGGWLQSRTIGARVASILRNREAEDEAAQDLKTKNKRRRYKVILHSSPFLRCIQTSIAISAGLASNPSPSTNTAASPHYLARSPRINQTSSSSPAPSRNHSGLSIDADASKNSDNIEKHILRIDPFLGEWLSPDYFDHITPPPRTSLMLGAAKAELLRKEDYNSYPHFNIRPTHYTPPPSGHLWRSPVLRSHPLPTHDESPELGPLDNLSGIKDSLPSNGGVEHKGHKVSLSEAAVDLGYTAPVPYFSVSTTQPIPEGYVSHAQDACVEVDYQWDSTQDNLAWGDGGVLPEEWASMHQRFRKGLKRLVDWYSTAHCPGEMVTHTPTSPTFDSSDKNGENNGCAVEDDEDYEVETVVILVSHGAGCNALVGGITNQPVLADVPMSSLTIARRRLQFDNRTDIVDESALKSLDDALGRKELGVPDIYELKLFANTDHLLSPSVLRNPIFAAIHGRSRDQVDPFPGALRDINFGAYNGESQSVHRSHSVNNASLGSMRRSSHAAPLGQRYSLSSHNDQSGVTVGNGAASFSPSRPVKTSRGLWSPKSDSVDEDVEPDQPAVANYSHEKKAEERVAPSPEQESSNGEVQQFPVLPPTTKDEEVQTPASWKHDHEEVVKFKHDGKLPGLWAGTGNGGLWGAPRPPGEAERLRDLTTHKRRWTINEHSMESPICQGEKH